MTKVEVPTYFTNHHAVSMTLRDYFAAAALPMAIQEMNEAESYNLNDSAVMAYHYADAMLRARSKENLND